MKSHWNYLRSRTVAIPVIALKFSGLCDAISVGNLESPTGEEQKTPERWKLEEMDQFRNKHEYINMCRIVSIYNYCIYVYYHVYIYIFRSECIMICICIYTHMYRYDIQCKDGDASMWCFRFMTQSIGECCLNLSSLPSYLLHTGSWRRNVHFASNMAQKIFKDYYPWSKDYYPCIYIYIIP